MIGARYTEDLADEYFDRMLKPKRPTKLRADDDYITKTKKRRKKAKMHKAPRPQNKN